MTDWIEVKVVPRTGKRRVTYYLVWKDKQAARGERWKATKAKTRTEAEKLALAKKRILNVSDYALLESQSRVTFFEILNDFLDDSAVRKGKNSGGYKRDCLSVSIIKRCFDDFPVERFDTSLMTQHTKKRRDEGVVDATINRELSAVKAAFYLAYKRRKVNYNHMARYSMLSEEDGRRERFITNLEYQKLYMAAVPWMKPLLAIGWECGWRIDELLSLTWKGKDFRVDFERGWVHGIDRKNKRRRLKRIPMEPANGIREVLQGLPRCSEYVFTKDGRRVTYAMFIRAFMAACAEARIPYGRKTPGGMTFHDFRHTFVTLKRREGHRDEAIMAITGHSTEYMLRYYDTVPEEDVRAVGKGNYQQALTQI